MDGDWKKIRIPLGLVVAFLVVCGSTYTYLQNSFVHASDFQQYRADQSRMFKDQQREQRLFMLERDLKKLETDKLILDVKAQSAPRDYTPVDRAVHGKVKTDIEDLKREIKDLKSQNMN